jgi:hypothetical protein
MQYRVEGNRLTVSPERGIVLKAGEELQVVVALTTA